MRDRPTKRGLFLGPLHVNVDPLVVVGRVGKSVDLRLCHQVPVGDAEFLSNHGFDILQLYLSHCHVLLLSLMRH